MKAKNVLFSLGLVSVVGVSPVLLGFSIDESPSMDSVSEVAKPEHGATPWRNCFGPNAGCDYAGCSEIVVTASKLSDVMVIIKRNNKIVKHAYVHAGRSYTFELPDGTYQPFFYYGRDWDPNKVMHSESCSEMKGGFTSNESFDKDFPETLSGMILSYELYEQIDGNFNTKPSNAQEAF